MAQRVPELDLRTDVASLTAALIDIPSESLAEQAIADAVESALSQCGHLRVQRDGNTLRAATDLGRPSRVIIAGHLDTVPSSGNVPHSRVGSDLFGLGSCDMKGGIAVALRCAASITAPVDDVTYLFYEAEEIASQYNGLRRISQTSPDWLRGDFAILMEPSDAGIEAGCQGSLRAEISVAGRRAHSARWWRGENAIHAATAILDRLARYQPRRVIIDGLEYREGLSAVGIRGGVAGNVIPDSCVVTVNLRYAPSMSAAAAEEHVREVFDGFEVTVTDNVAGALPGLHEPAARAFVAAVGAAPRPKFGWTDVALFGALGIPAVNFGPGDPSLAHAPDEHVPVQQLIDCERALTAWLSG